MKTNLHGKFNDPHHWAATIQVKPWVYLRKCSSIAFLSLDIYIGRLYFYISDVIATKCSNASIYCFVFKDAVHALSHLTSSYFLPSIFALEMPVPLHYFPWLFCGKKKKEKLSETVLNICKHFPSNF